MVRMSNLFVACLFCVFVAAIAGATRAGEREVAIESVPPAVRKAILRKSTGHTIKEIEEITKGGKKFYEAEWIADGKKIGVCVASDGTVLRSRTETADNFERELAIDEIPSAVRTAILKLAAKDKIGDVRSVTELSRAKQKTYEAGWKVGSVEVEVQVTNKGALLSRKEEKHASINHVPAAVRKRILKEAGGRSLRKLEQITQNGRYIYEAKWAARGKEVEILVSHTGKLLKRKVADIEEAGDDGDDDGDDGDNDNDDDGDNEGDEDDDDGDDGDNDNDDEGDEDEDEDED